MPDKFFFPLIALLAALMVFIALDPFKDRLPSGPMSAAGADPYNLVIDGKNLYRMTAGEVGSINLLSGDEPEGDPEDDIVRLQITLAAKDAYDTPLYGPYMPFDSDIEKAYENQHLRVTLTARTGGKYPASEFEANYFTGARGESGWRKFTLTRAFADYSFDYRVPASNAGLGNDYLAIRPVTPDKERTLEVKAIRLQKLPN